MQPAQYRQNDYAMHNGHVAHILEVHPIDRNFYSVKIELIKLDKDSNPLDTDDFPVLEVTEKDLFPLANPEDFLIAALYKATYARDEIIQQLESKNGEISRLVRALNRLKSDPY